MLFPDTLYEKDLPADPMTRRLVMSLTAGKCTAAVWDDNIPASLRVIATDRITTDSSGQWTGLEDFLYDNPGLLAPMSHSTVLLATPDITIAPDFMSDDDASRLLRVAAVSEDATDPAFYQASWENVESCRIGMLLPSKLLRFIRRSFQPVNIGWYATPIVRYWQRVAALSPDHTSSRRLRALAVVTSYFRVTVVVIDADGKLVAIINRKGTASSDLTYHILSLLTSLSSDIRSDVSLSLFGSPALMTSVKEELSGWINAQLHVHITGKPSIIDQAQCNLLEPEILAAINTSE